MSRLDEAEVPGGMYERILCFTVAFGAAVGLAITGCNAKLDTVLASDDSSEAGADAATPSGANTCAAHGGQCVDLNTSSGSLPAGDDEGQGTCTGGLTCVVPDADAGPHSIHRPPICTADEDCNDDVAISRLPGQCFQGYCFCNPGFHAQKNGKCGPAAPLCTDIPNAVCVSGAVPCPAGQVLGDSLLNTTCGDLVPAVCCTSSCAGPDVSCCSKDKGGTDTVCVNGFRQCEYGSPMTKGAICN